MQRDLSHPVNDVEHRIAVNGIVGCAELGVAGGQEDVVLVDSVHHIHRREMTGLQLDAVKIHHHRPDFAAVDQWRDRPGLRHDLRPHLVSADIE